MSSVKVSTLRMDFKSADDTVDKDPKLKVSKLDLAIFSAYR
jgi:hypothetical protein